MRNWTILAVCAAALACFTLVGRAGDDAPPTKIALLDVARVFKEHKGFTTGMTALKKDLETRDGEFRRKQESLQKQAQELRGMETGSPEYRLLEQTIAKEAAAIRARQSELKRDVMKREADIYGRVYVELQDVVRRYAADKGFTLVTKFDSTPIDTQVRDSILKSVNKTVVYHAGGLDITDAIIALVNRD